MATKRESASVSTTAETLLAVVVRIDETGKTTDVLHIFSSVHRAQEYVRVFEADVQRTLDVKPLPMDAVEPREYSGKALYSVDVREDGVVLNITRNVLQPWHVLNATRLRAEWVEKDGEPLRFACHVIAADEVAAGERAKQLAQDRRLYA